MDTDYASSAGMSPASNKPCRQCKDMEEFSSKLWKRFLDKIKVDMANKDTSTGSKASSNTAFVDQSQFQNFEERMLNVMRSFMGHTAMGSVGPQSGMSIGQATIGSVGP